MSDTPKNCREHELAVSQPTEAGGDPADTGVTAETEFAGGFDSALAKVRAFPTTPGVYLMKDAAGRVIYVGKAKNLRARAGSYFLKAAAEERRTADLVREIHDIDFLPAESEVDALLVEARLVKDIQPKFNQELERRQDVSVFGNLHSRGFSASRIYPRAKEIVGRSCTARLPAPAACGGRFKCCKRFSNSARAAWTLTTATKNGAGFGRACWRRSINARRRAICGFRRKIISATFIGCECFWKAKSGNCLDEMHAEMEQAAKELKFEKAARLRDEIHLLETLDNRGELDEHVQPEVFFIDPKKGLVGLKKVLKLAETPRTIEGVDIAHLGGDETVASLVQFIDGLPFKPGYKRFKIRDVQGIDDFRSIHEVVSRRFARLHDEAEVFPDVLLIDGGKGQLNAALAAFSELGITPPTVISIAKREEEIYVPGSGTNRYRLSRHSYALRLLQYVRDEAHRFAQHYHHLLRRKSTLGE